MTTGMAYMTKGTWLRVQRGLYCKDTADAAWHERVWSEASADLGWLRPVHDLLRQAGLST